ncbi:hypothetical protein [Paraflavitalea sp. CAU 1676]|uniref:hypothetical protein n=1 Tax=Paraflavitalea sp. CAU 1676 TaxID=3032598 RepID=UPI0023DC9F54|nr:hypothetical protein [Paraflavitalea sp. CAU 1676]MDF2188946.1 hypothetical protein [Paraflavitalea sp. CAU 1676]
MANRGFRILGLPLIWALLIGVVVFILWKPITALFKGLAQKFKSPEQTAAEPAATTTETEIKNS